MTIFLGQEGHINEVKQVEKQRQVDLEAREEADYQMAIAQSLDLPYMAPTTSTTHLLPTSSIGQLGGHSAPQPTPRNVSNITQHMNKDWMQPVEDKMIIPHHPNREGGDNCFTIIFWNKVQILENVLH